MKNSTESVNSIVGKVQNAEEGFALPAIQRPYVWKEKQIAMLFDSILRSYPLGVLMIWKTKKDLSTRSFVKDWKSGEDFALNKDIPVKTKNVILDGQQRLQSLLIGMRGTYNGRSLYFNLLSDPKVADKTSQGDMAYEFRFFAKQPADRRWIAVRELSQSNVTSATKLAKGIVGEGDSPMAKASEQVIENIEVFRARLSDLNYLGYILLDETSDQNLIRSEEDIVEIFVRSNSGGTKLNKSDLLFSLLSSRWEPAYANIRALEKEIASADFDFTRDYILKATLMCVGEGAAYKIDKFKKPEVLEKVEKEWDAIASAFSDVIAFLQTRTPVTSRKSLVSANSLLPLIAMRHRMTTAQWTAFDQSKAAEYILRTSLARSFAAGKDNLLDDLRDSMVAGFDLNKVFAVLKSANRSIDFSSKKIWAISYKDRTSVYFALSKVVKGFSLDQLSGTNIDHIIPKALMKGREKDVNQLANLTVLSEADNKSKGKKLLAEWLAEMDDETLRNFCSLHAIPCDRALWTPKNFDEFIFQRKRLISTSTQLGNLFKVEDQVEDEEEEDSES
jgi:Protein of unknown function DUF262